MFDDSRWPKRRKLGSDAYLRLGDVESPPDTLYVMRQKNEPVQLFGPSRFNNQHQSSHNINIRSNDHNHQQQPRRQQHQIQKEQLDGSISSCVNNNLHEREKTNHDQPIVGANMRELQLYYAIVSELNNLINFKQDGNHKVKNVGKMKRFVSCNKGQRQNSFANLQIIVIVALILNGLVSVTNGSVELEHRPRAEDGIYDTSKIREVRSIKFSNDIDNFKTTNGQQYPAEQTSSGYFSPSARLLPFDLNIEPASIVDPSRYLTTGSIYRTVSGQINQIKPFQGAISGNDLSQPVNRQSSNETINDANWIGRQPFAANIVDSKDLIPLVASATNSLDTMVASASKKKKKVKKMEKKKKKMEKKHKEWKKGKKHKKKKYESKKKKGGMEKKKKGKKMKKKWGEEKKGHKKKGNFKKKKWGHKKKMKKGHKKGKKGHKKVMDKGHKKKGFKKVYHKEEWGKKKKWHDIKREKKWNTKQKKWKKKWQQEKGKKYKGKHMKKYHKKNKHGKKYKKEKKSKWKKHKGEKFKKGHKKKKEEFSKKKEGGKKKKMKKFKKYEKKKKKG